MHSNVQAQLRRDRMSSRKPSHEEASGRVADPISHVDERVARRSARNFHRQPEIHHSVDDDVIIVEKSTQRKRISVRPRSVVKGVYKDIGLHIHRNKVETLNLTPYAEY